jgi:hypothetical protein
MTPIAVDIETVNGEGKADFRWWKPGFKILSLALSWRGLEIESWFTADPAEIDRAVRRLAATRRPLIVHNLAFEMGVFETLYPDLEFNWHADTMRLAQLNDNGGDWRDQVFNSLGDLDEEESPDLGLSLEAVASRVLQRDLHHHKNERDDYLRTIGIRSKFGAHIHLLPGPILERYNIMDTSVTLELFETLAPLLDGVWQKDWQLYYNRAKLMCSSYRRGILIDTAQLQAYIYELDAKIDEIEQEFVKSNEEGIKKWAELTQNPVDSFNCGSNKQLKELFCDVMGMTAGHITKSGEEKVKKKELTREEALKKYPSFQSKHLSDWGPAGKILEKRRKLLLVLSQALSTLVMAEKGGGRVHPEQKVAGTRTNRVAGGESE